MVVAGRGGVPEWDRRGCGSAVVSPLELGERRCVGGRDGARWGPTYKSESLHFAPPPHARTHQFAAVLLQVGYPINATQISI